MGTDITDFFSNKKTVKNGKKTVTTSKAPTKSKSPKKLKKPAKEESDDDLEEYIPLDKQESDFALDDDEEEIMEILETRIDTPKRKRVPKVEDEDVQMQTSPVKKSPKKKAGKPPAKEKPQPKEKPKEKAVRGKSGNTNPDSAALTLLNSIPDCELPEVDSNAKVNFFAKKAQLDAQLTDESFRLPEGKPNCLVGLTIVFTGNLPHLNREDCEALAVKYGAKVTKSVSGKTSVVVLGSDAGPSKVTKIQKLGIKHIDEAGFVTLIEGLPEDGGEDNEAAKKVLAKKEEAERAMQATAEKEAKEAEVEEQKRRKRVENQSEEDYVKPSDRPDSEKLWTVKYAPTKVSQICGNKGQVTKMTKWLANWDSNKKAKFRYYGESFPAILISGPPGIGKTTAAHIIAKDLGYDIIEKNASDVRSKSLLNLTIKDVLDNTSVVSFFDKLKKKDNKLCLIMDEVDGMSSGDMGGVGALAQFCRKTSIPIILICNDKSLPKMRPFDKVAMDVQFRRPDATSIRSRILTIALREKIKVPPEVIDRLVEYTKNDIRQIINLLSTVSKTTKELSGANYKEAVNGWEKNVAMKTFDIAGKYLSSGIWSSSSKVSLNEKIQYYFDDHSFVPLMVHENYMATNPSKSGSSLEHLKLVQKASNSISEGDIVDSKIHSSEQQWSLMPLHAVMSSIRPASYVNGQISGRINFTSYLGANSKRNKYQRLLTDLNYHSKLATLSDKSQFRLNYVNLLSKKLSDPLIDLGTEGIPEVIELLDAYYFTKEDWDYILDFNIGTSQYKLENVTKKIPTAVKSGFTRKYNSTKHAVSIYRVGVAGSTSKGVSSAKPDLEDAVDDDIEEVKEEDEEEESQDIVKDKLIKAKKPSAKKPSKKRAAPAKGRATKKTKS